MTSLSSDGLEDGIVDDTDQVRSLGYNAAYAGQLTAPKMWHLSTTVPGGAGFAEAWAYAKGEGTVISVVDEGVNYRHADLAWAYDATIDYDPRDAADAMDARPDLTTQRHGTNVAGLISGDMANAIATVGAAQGSILTATFLRYGENFVMSELADIIAHQANYDVSNNSWGFTTAFADNFENANFATTAAALAGAVGDGREGLGTVFVFAAGNGKVMKNGVSVSDDAGFHSLAASRFTIAVGAHDDKGTPAFFSSPGANVLLTAPGMSVLTTNGGSDGATEYSYVSGTSFAAPLVSSAVALILSENPLLGYRDVQEILALSSRSRLGGPTAANGATAFNGGGLMFDREGGFGTLDAAAAVNLARHWHSQSTAANEQRLELAFAIPASLDKTRTVLEAELISPDATGFSIDHVSLHVNLYDRGLKDLSIALVSPDGTRTAIAESMAVVGSRTSLNFTFGSVATWGEDPFGTWRVELTHSQAPSTFIAFEASLQVYGDWDTPDDTAFITGSFADLAALDPGRATLVDTDGGVDTLNFAASKTSAIVDLSRETASSSDGVVIVLAGEYENVIGSVESDRLTGSDAANRLVGDDGDDTLLGGAGDDTLDGGTGDDRLQGGDGSDRLDGGLGIDTVVLDGSFFDYAVTREGTLYAITDRNGALDRVTAVEWVSVDGFLADLTLAPDILVSAAPSIGAITAHDGGALVVDDGSTGTPLATITGHDPNLLLGDVLSFSLSGLDGRSLDGAFSIAATATSQAVLTFVGGAAGSYDLLVTATDRSGHAVTETVVVTVLHRNAGPTAIAMDHLSVDEAADGRIVGRVGASDPEGDDLVFTVDDPRFEVAVTEAGLVLRLVAGMSLDFEHQASVTVGITATDGGGATFTKDFTIVVNDVDEAATGA
ncbi:S8 family serine peptidase, partial [Methylobacterium sp. Leaf108]|uniref:S8 family serine peptidase n=1 Tax=Methylobacterium sp. Leaf108 TaxID=1736256 RepID=UPI000701FAB0